MKTYTNLSEFKKIEKAVVTIGTYDGLHLGHQKIIKSLCQLAKEVGGESVILTFFPHPRMIIDPENQDLKMINTVDEKIEILRKLGVDHLIITPFTRDFSNLSAEDYIENILVNTIGTKHIIIGYDHRFGKNREGGIHSFVNYAPNFGYQVVEIPEQDVNDVAVSSTKIRTAILEGNITLANQYLGTPFFVTGRVIKGDKIGRTIGFPTANIFVAETYKILPKDGVYAVSVTMKEGSKETTYEGMGYLGRRPTINGMTRNVEVNIFDFDEEIYGQTIQLNFLKLLRQEIKFESLEALKNQLNQDKLASLAFFETQK
ncbi:MAG: bifunctional riboflavin kinase/FAD synthetase [Sphingobacteriaceae bacterium]|nr:bifunctional riboflavin kinase/FAD synthetase [Sphingobacteriaceae bacterium]